MVPPPLGEHLNFHPGRGLTRRGTEDQYQLLLTANGRSLTARIRTALTISPLAASSKPRLSAACPRPCSPDARRGPRDANRRIKPGYGESIHSFKLCIIYLEGVLRSYYPSSGESL